MDAFIDMASHLVATARAIEAPEARLLARIEELVEETGQALVGPPSPEGMHWHGDAASLVRSTSLLLREGLAREGSGYGGIPVWTITDFGRTFLAWIREAEGEGFGV